MTHVKFFSYFCSMILGYMRKWIVFLLMLLMWETQQAASLQTEPSARETGQVGPRRVTDSAWRAEVKTVTLTRSGVELEAPVLALGSNERMVLQFDILSDEAENLTYSIFHCDANWRRDDLEPYEFMTGFESGHIENIEFSFGTLQPYVHYHQAVPDKYASFIHSGNYCLAVVNEAGDTLLTRRFWVSEQAVNVEATIERPYDGHEVMRRQEVDVKIKNEELRMKNISAPQLRPEYERVLVQQNGREDNIRWLEFTGYERYNLCYRHRQANIFYGGNTFRYFDCSNLHTPMYNVQRVEEYGGEIFALLRPEENRSKKHYLSETTLNGGMKVNVVDRNNKKLQAEYVWANISLPVAQPWLDMSIYVVGQLTDWKLDSTSRMEYVPEFKAYVKRLLVKQGYYSYQLLTARYVDAAGQGDAASRVSTDGMISVTEQLEGDHMETPNTYTIFVYHREPSDRADRLLAVRRIQ